MVYYSNVFIECALEGLLRLIVPKRTVILSCFIFIVFVNILTCLKANHEVTTLPNHNYHEIVTNISSSPENSNRNTSTSHTAPATTSTTATTTTTTISPLTELSSSMIAQPFKSSVRNEINHDRNIGATVGDASVSDITTDISTFQHNDQEFHHRIGLAATSDVSRNSSFLHPTTSSIPKSSNLFLEVTTTSSISDGDDSDDELRKIYIGNTLLSASGEETTTLASSQAISKTKTISDKNFDQILFNSAHRDINDMQVLETNASTSINPSEENLSSRLSHNSSSSENQYNPALETQRLWPSPLHNHGPYRVPPISVQATQKPGGIVLQGDKPQVYDQTNHIEQPILDSLISNASLLDLLHVIKHLNLINGSGDSSQQISDQLLNSNTDVNSIYTRPKPISSPFIHSYPSGSNMNPPINNNLNPISSKSNLDKLLQAESGDILLGRKMNQPSLGGSSELLATLESSLPEKIISKYQQQLHQEHVTTDQSDRELTLNRSSTDSNWREATKLVTKYVTLDNEQRPIKKPPKHTLNPPPYIANFDSGLGSLTRNGPINRAVKSNLREKIMTSGDLSNSDRQQADPSKIVSSSVKIHQLPSISTKLDRPKTSQILYNSLSDTDFLYGKSGKKHQTSKQHKSGESQENKIRPKGTVKSNFHEPSPSPLPPPMPPLLHSTVNSDTNSKRGERDTFDHNQNQKATDSYKTNDHQDENQGSSIVKMKQADEKSSAGDHQAHSEPNQVQHKIKEPPYPIIDRTYTSSSTQSSHVKLPIKINVDELALDRNAKQVPAYLNDPHKKSYYWTSERGDVYLDDLNNSPQYPVQLTIGELARHHGIVPLGLQHTSPLSTLLDSIKFNQHQTAVEDFGLSSESGFSEDYASFVPPNHQKDPSMVHQHNLPQQSLSNNNVIKPANHNNNNNNNNNNFKIDEQLKQKIAIKAIEAASKDPELSATLFGSLLNLAAGDHHDTLVSPIRAVHPNHLDQHQISAPPTKPHLSYANGSVYRNSYKSYSPTDMSPSSSAPAVNPLNHLAVMMPMATMPDNQHANYLHQPMNSSSSVQPINLVITDLANRWALSRMPDLVPIPLAATVPGYLIRLPDGKILAAALTSLFSIQGIQRGPLTANYKNLINNKFNGLMKSSASSGYNQIQQPAASLQYGSSVSDSYLRPTVILPAPHYHHQYANRFVTKAKNNPMDQKGGLFARGVLSQLGLGTRTNLRLNNRTQAPKLYSTSQSHKLIKNNNNSNRANGANSGSQNRQRIIKLTSSSFPVPSLTSQELANLPIASPNEPVFSFADESQLLDTPDYLQPRLPQINQPLFGPRGYNQAPPDQPIAIDVAQQQQQQLDLLESGSGTNLVNFGDRLNRLLSNSRNIAHLDRLSGLNDEQLFNYRPKKRKSFTNLPLSKLEPLYQWLTSIKPVKLLRKDSKACTEKI